MYTENSVSCENIIQTNIPDQGNRNEVNVLHISDLHFGIGQNVTEKELFRTHRSDLLKNLIRQLYEYTDCYGNWKPDIVVVSGDIAYKAKKDEYEQFFEDFYNILTIKGIDIRNNREHFVLDNDCIVLCPGNHDVTQNIYNSKRYKSIYSDIIRRPAKPISNAAIGYELKDIPNNYKQILPEHFNDKSKPKAEPFGNYIDACCGGNPEKLVQLCIPKKWPWVHFAVLNSAWDSRKGNDEGRLRVGLRLYQSLLNKHRQQNTKNSILCTVFHHPLDSIEDNNGNGGERRVYNWLAPSECYAMTQNIDYFSKYVRDTSKCIMNGHVHEAHTLRYIGNGDRMAAWSVCGSTLPSDRQVYHCRVIKFRRGEGMVHCCDCTSTADDPNSTWRLTTGPVSLTDDIQFKAKKDLDRVGEITVLY